MSNITPLLEHNNAFAASGAWRNTPRLPFLPFQGLYIITCVDPRSRHGRRDSGPLVHWLPRGDQGPEGPYFEAVVIHHTNCGTRLLEDPVLRYGFAKRSGYDEAMLARLPATVPAETVRADVRKILAAPQISSRITVSGLVYDTTTGLLEMVADPARPAPLVELVVERSGIAVPHAVAG
jgi:carbonic anhydrase